MTAIRIAFISDIHNGRDLTSARGTAALPLLEKFVADANDAAYDAIVDLGDRISDESSERDRELLAEVAQHFQQLDAPRHHICGNHDLNCLTQSDNEALLDGPTNTRSVLVGGLRLAFWQPSVKLSRQHGLRLDDGDLSSLRDLLNDDERPTLLLTHVPLSGHSLKSNFYFENNPGHATYAEIDDIRQVISQAPCPIAAIAGHVHWNTLTTVDGVPHLSLQSLTETFTVGEAAGATAIMEITDHALHWTVRGKDPLSLTLRWPQSGRPWRTPLPPIDG